MMKYFQIGNLDLEDEYNLGPHDHKQNIIKSLSIQRYSLIIDKCLSVLTIFGHKSHSNTFQ